MLRYRSADSGPYGYANRILLVAAVPFLPLLLFGIDPRASALTKTYFTFAALWLLAVGFYGLRQLLNAIWAKRR